nr:MAG TPA: hypothetical protein [Caudoviricetes sp.]
MLYILIFCQRYEKYSLISAFCLIANKIHDFSSLFSFISVAKRINLSFFK